MSARRFRRGVVPLAAALVGLICSGPAAAWGKRGHALTAELAYERLTPAAKAQVDQLMALAPQQGTPACPATSIGLAADWPDCIRKHEPAMEKQMALHHTNRFPLCGPIDFDASCKNGHCAVGDIERETSILGDRRANPIDRLHALEAVLHLVGDEHQPVHAASTAASQGNPVTFPGQKKPTNVHGLWDSQLVDFSVPKGDAGAALLRADIAKNASRWMSGNPKSWAFEANQVARKSTFGALPTPTSCGIAPPGVTEALDANYLQQEEPIVREQIEKGAVRLAMLLNQTLGR